MSKTIERSYPTRRDADLAIEHLVQQFGIERTDIFVASAGRDASAGPETEEGRAGAPITVSVDVQSDKQARLIENGLDELS
ncbi:hypothetical protein GRI97_16100 [Altererythrobacter xixiisoli]|uniref:Uncharacterized protein n=1 Tax=Croceibacterium xixiisoli TaxID=1476466 RepID=A0A6I4TX82_9SPHN|nr:hypothetical protein [Croceibacterium xixiisoli]MXP00513.1 hypothetical protein [Croceibacterium xixiisoli]